MMVAVECVMRCGQQQALYKEFLKELLRSKEKILDDLEKYPYPCKV